MQGKRRRGKDFRPGKLSRSWRLQGGFGPARKGRGEGRLVRPRIWFDGPAAVLMHLPRWLASVADRSIKIAAFLRSKTKFSWRLARRPGPVRRAGSPDGP